jgi:hypothetical protein
LDLGDQHIWARYKDHATFEVSFVPQVVYAKVMAKVIKLKCAFVVEKLISKLRNCFPFYELMEALGVVYPQYSLGFDLKTSFQLHLNVNKNCFKYAIVIVVTYSQFDSNIRVLYIFFALLKKYLIQRPIFKPLYFYNVF